MLTSLWLAFLLGTTTPSIIVADEPTATTTPALIAYHAKLNGVDARLAEKIATCESGLTQFDSEGQPLRGKLNRQDIGLFQINEHYHLDDSRKAGMDIYTEEGNIRYAMKLLKEQGSRPWNWSRACWEK